MFTILRDPETGETICTDEPEGEGPNFVEIGETDRQPQENEVWDEISEDWVTDEEAVDLRTERQWNMMFSVLRSKIFELQARIYMLEQEVMSRREDDE